MRGFFQRLRRAVRPLAQRKCLNRLNRLGERHHRRAVAEFVAHYHREWHHQGLAHELIEPQRAKGRVGRVRRHQLLVGRSTSTHGRRGRSGVPTRVGTGHYGLRHDVSRGAV